MRFRFRFACTPGLDCVTAIILQIPSLVVAILSCAIMTSGGSLRTTDKIKNCHYFLFQNMKSLTFFSNYKHFFFHFLCIGTLARAGGTFFFLETCGGLMGMIVFTMQE